MDIPFTIRFLLKHGQGYMGKFFSTIKMVICQLYATLSNNKTFLSAKRVERMLLFNSALGMAVCYVWYNRATISTSDIVIICTMLFGYAGFNVVMGNKEKKDEKSAIQTDKIIEEKIDDKNQKNNPENPEGPQNNNG